MGNLERQYISSGTLDDLPRILEFAESIFEEAGVDPEAHFGLQLAIEEACANVLEHAYAGDSGEFTLSIAVSGRDMYVTLTDRGRPFDPNSVAPPALDVPLEDRRVGGLGLHLMRELMDEVSFSFTAQGNVLRMIKRDVVHGSSDA